MYRQGILAVLCAAVILQCPRAQSQCLSENDQTTTVSEDLTNIADFSIDLFREIFPYNASKNFFFSPYSIWSSLMLSYFGSEGHTMMQLQKVLRTTDKVSAMQQWRQLQYLYDTRQINNTDYSFHVASKAYFDKSVQLRQCLKDILDVEIENLDFSKSDETAKTINDFVSHVTKTRISQIVTASDVGNSRMMLVNAAFFKGIWLNQFKKSKTKQEVFYASPEDLYFVDMMHQKGSFRSGSSDELGANILELPYNGGEISMIILLPPFLAGEEGFNRMVEKLNGVNLHRAISTFGRSQVKIAIPKFKLEETIKGELIESLMKMGITDLFDSTSANLTAFDPAGGLSVGKSVHKAFVEVSEEGTEAAAATALFEFRSARPLGPLEFVCNHPFLFLIYDNVTHNILFMGTYKNPKA